MVTFAEAGQALESRRVPLVGIVLALGLSACSRRSAEQAPPPAEQPNVTASAHAPESTPLPAQKPPPPAVTPAVPPQLVACGERDFYRITGSALQVFEIAEKLPPPQIRGSRVAIQTGEVAIGEPTNVFSPAPKSAVVIAKSGVYRHELGKKQPRRYAPIPASAPLVAWADARSPNAFRVRAAGDEKLQRYSLDGRPSVDLAAPVPPAQAAPQAEELPRFDRRLFTLLADGSYLYSTPNGLERRGNDTNATPFPPATGPVTLVFADPSPGHFWTADAAGGLALWKPEPGAPPQQSFRVSGVVIDTALEGERVAVLSLDVQGQTYRPAVTIFSHGKEEGRLSIGPSFARRPPELDLCVIKGRPWVLVGSTRWMQLLDWETRRLLAEW